MLEQFAKRYVAAREEMQRLEEQLAATDTDFPSGAERIRAFRNATKAELDAFEALRRLVRSLP